MNYEEIKKIVEYMEKSTISELEIEFPENGGKIRMKKENNVQEEKAVLKDNKPKEINPESIDGKIPEKENCKLVKSPMVGTFYSSSSPKAEPFVKVGDTVKKGQVLCIIEAMKLMNEIESEFDGVIKEICVKDEDIVEYGKTLFKIEEN